MSGLAHEKLAIVLRMDGSASQPNSRCIMACVERKGWHHKQWFVPCVNAETHSIRALHAALLASHCHGCILRQYVLLHSHSYDYDSATPRVAI
jgi:hypothetical protein